VIPATLTSSQERQRRKELFQRGIATQQGGKMNTLIIYDSQFGNTERIAQAIADTLRAFG
jgi:flavorubredoxin